jgi:hypothetical protein
VRFQLPEEHASRRNVPDTIGTVHLVVQATIFQNSRAESVTLALM